MNSRSGILSVAKFDRLLSKWQSNITDKERDVIIIHCHMFKNAGTSFDWSLRRFFGSGFVDHRDDVNMREGASYLSTYLEQHQHIKALSSHHVQIPLPAMVEQARLIPAVIFRHPIERVRSVYEFERRQRADTPGAINAKKLSFADYVRWRMEPSVGATLRDFQTRYCIGALKNPKRCLTDHSLTEALHFVRDTPLVGAVELFDESMVLFEDALRAWYPDIDLSYLVQNVGRNDVSKVDARIDSIRKDLGVEIYEELMKNNAYDLQLYAKAQTIIQERMTHTPRFEHRLFDFRKRCIRLKRSQTASVDLRSQRLAAGCANSWLVRISEKFRRILK